ncbi:MAG: GTPase HflX [Deltaproteobacteria bacterium]|nr:GTPase HflX [Deltaproteobacteria bacterium]
MSKLEGQITGLKANQLHRLRRFYRRRVPPALLISPELARDISMLSSEIGRQVGLLLDRSGSVSSVVIGNNRGLFLPVMIAAIQVNSEGLPEKIEAAHLLPVNDGGQTVARLSAANVTSLNLDFTALIQALEDELAMTQAAAQVTGLKDRAILASVTPANRAEAEDSLVELEELARTAGLEVLDKIILRQRKGKSSHLLGRDRLSELTIRAFQLGADIFVFEQDLSPVEINRLTDLVELRIIDRTQLILDIFAQRARTREGKIQVEMAQLKYMLPRLIKKNTAMSRLTGGIGGRGPGETKLEINRRRVRERISRLKKELDQIKAQRGRHRARRAREGLPVVSIIGYTNAGKSTLLNNLTNSNVLAENRLFATLDPTSRRLKFPRDRAILITDTVGFIRNLPPDLIEAFAATLEELSSADLLLHVIDVSNPQFSEQIQAVEEILGKLDLSHIPILPVLNKADLADPEAIPGLVKLYDALALSAIDPDTFPPLIEELQRRLHWAESVTPKAKGYSF